MAHYNQHHWNVSTEKAKNMASPYYKQHWINIEPERHKAYDQILAYHPALEPLIRPLNLGPGLKILDVGSGPGYTTMELARRTGSSGHAAGVDLNADFVLAASRRARANQLDISFVQSEFPPLPFRSGSFDRVLCKNVLEYVDSAGDTVKEMARITNGGGTVVAIDSDWDMLALSLPEHARKRSERVLAAAKSIAVKEPKIGRMLYSLFRAAGLKDVRVEVFAGADTVGRAAPMLKASLARYARDSGQIASAEVEQWLRDIDGAILDGQYLMVLPQFVVRGSKYREATEAD
jgi:ubiquinone/menaquinone biosynthesis C-methylase UbiE